MHGYTSLGRRIAWRSLATTVLLATLIGCGSGSGAGSPNNPSVRQNSTGGTGPKLTFKASKNVIKPGGMVTLSWQSKGAKSCVASGDWSGSLPNSGKQKIGPVQSDQSFALSCTGPDGTRLKELFVRVGDKKGVTVALEAHQPAVREGGQTRLSWTTRNARKCEASGGWTGAQPTQGEFETPQLAQDTTFKLSCSGKGDSAVALVTVAVTDGTLRWQAPHSNVDGTKVKGLRGFNVYWGNQSREYEGSIGLSAKARAWLVELNSGSYFFAITAVDKDGNESGFSNEVEKFIP